MRALLRAVFTRTTISVTMSSLGEVLEGIRLRSGLKKYRQGIMWAARRFG